LSEDVKRIPIARCPVCNRTIVYSDDPKDKRSTAVRVADENYHGKTVLCAKCKTMLAVIEKPKVARGYVTVTIVSANA